MALPSRLKNNDDLYQPLADINVTPLVDVMLVLLIIFMITAPLLAKGVKVNLPQAKAAQPLNQKDPIIVTIGKEGKSLARLRRHDDRGVGRRRPHPDGRRSHPRRSCARRQ